MDNIDIIAYLKEKLQKVENVTGSNATKYIEKSAILENAIEETMINLSSTISLKHKACKHGDDIVFYQGNSCPYCKIAEAVKQRQDRFDNLSLLHCAGCGKVITADEKAWPALNGELFCKEDCAIAAEEKLNTPPLYKDM